MSNRGLCEALGLEYHPELDVYDDFIPTDSVKYSPPVPKGKDAYWYGKNLSEETKIKISQTKTGITLSDEHKKKIRTYRHTEEARLNISKNHHFAKKGRPGHGEKMKEFYKQNPDKSPAGKTWKIDQVTGKRVWVSTAQAF